MVASAVKIQEYVKGVHYPASKQDLIRKAKERGADTSIISTLQKHPDKRYQSSIDLMMEYSEIVQI